MRDLNLSVVKKLLLFTFLVTLRLDVISQCTGCSTLVTDNSVSSYTVNSGNSLCIASNFTYTGHLYLKGGTICNDGVVNKIHLYSGTLNNNFNSKLSVSTTTNLSFNLDGKCIINNYSGSQIVTSADIIVDAAYSDSLIINIHKGASVNCNDLTVNTGKIRLNVGLAATTVTNNPFITSMNVNGNATFKSHLNMQVKDVANFNTNGYLVLRDVGIKTVNNYGIINTTGTVGILGDGSSTSTVTINNYGNFSSLASMTSSMTNASVSINNFGGAANSILYVDGSINLEQNNNLFTNNDVIELSGSISVNHGTFVNNYFAQVADLNINTGVYTNNSKTNLLGSLSVTGADGILNNNGKMLIANDLVNNGTINLSKASVCSTKNFTNNVSQGKIIGPSDILDGTGHDLESNHAKIIISDLSANSGTLSGFLAIFELSYSGGSSTRIDDFDKDSKVGRDVKFPTECTFDLEVGYISAWNSGSLRPRSIFCPGENITIGFFPYLPITTGPTWSYSITATLISASGNNLSVGGLLTGGMVNVSGYYYNGVQSCPFSIDYSVTVGNGAIAVTSPVYFGVGNNVTLNSTVTVGSPPFSFTWSPNYFFVSPSTMADQSPTISPGVSLIYTVNVIDGYGCTASNTVEVIGEPFALLDKQLTGEYYQLFQNKLFFKHDAQYDITGIRYLVYDKSNAVVASYPIGSNNLLNITTLSPGDNRLTLNASSLSAGYYVLEVANEKNEKLYLRFQK